MNKQISEMTDTELIKEIVLCDVAINAALTHSSLNHYPSYIKELGDFYYERTKLIDELLRRKDAQKTK